MFDSFVLAATFMIFVPVGLCVMAFWLNSTKRGIERSKEENINQREYGGRREPNKTHLVF